MTLKTLWQLGTLLIALSATGCNEFESQSDEPAPVPVEEVFVGMPFGMSSAMGPPTRKQIEQLVAKAVPGTGITFFMAGTGDAICVVKVPEGSDAYRESELAEDLAVVYQLLDPEMSGSPQAVDLISLPATIRKLRNTDLPPRVIIVGSPMISDLESGTGITSKQIYCDGCVTAEGSPFERMATFPQGTICSWLLPRAEYGNGPNHRAQIEHFLRYLIHLKGALLLRLSPSAEVVFGSSSRQWDEEPKAQDDCDGLRDVALDEVTTTYAPDGKTERVRLDTDVVVHIQSPDEQHLKGDRTRVAFLPDYSASMVINPDQSDGSHRLQAVKNDLLHKLQAMECEEFMVLGYGGWDSLEPRLLRYPSSWFGTGWAKATNGNRRSAIKSVQAMKAGGGTPLLPALRELLKLDKPPTMVVVYGDGAPTLEGGMPEVLTFVEEQLLATGCTVNTVGVGALSVRNKEFDWAGGIFFAKLAHLTQGEYFVLPDAPSTTHK